MPPQALGFRVSNRAVEVVDIGTEFSMVADDHGGADVLVLEGEVEAMPSGHEDSDAIVLQATNRDVFAQRESPQSENPARMMARFSSGVPLDRFSDQVAMFTGLSTNFKERPARPRSSASRRATSA